MYFPTNLDPILLYLLILSPSKTVNSNSQEHIEQDVVAKDDNSSFLVAWQSGTPSATERAGRTDLFMVGMG